MKKTAALLGWALLCLGLTLLYFAKSSQDSELDLLQSQSGSQIQDIQIANPASEYCLSKWGRLEKQSFEESEVQNCILPNWEIREERNFFHSDPYIWLSVSGALALAEKNQVIFRIVELDGESLPATMDLMPGRINASIQSGIVISAFSE